jgi:hypothetical protein
MASFAKIGLNSKVMEVHSLHNNELKDSNGVEQEVNGIDFLNTLFKTNDVWKQTFTDGTRKNYAGIGYTYDEDRDAFIAPQNYPSWTLNEDTCRWEAPSAMPDDGKSYLWNEETLSWKEIEIEIEIE